MFSRLLIIVGLLVNIFINRSYASGGVGSVVTWGRSSEGGDSSSVASALSANVTVIYSSEGAFAAIVGSSTPPLTESPAMEPSSTTEPSPSPSNNPVIATQPPIIDPPSYSPYLVPSRGMNNYYQPSVSASPSTMPSKGSNDRTMIVIII